MDAKPFIFIYRLHINPITFTSPPSRQSLMYLYAVRDYFCIITSFSWDYGCSVWKIGYLKRSTPLLYCRRRIYCIMERLTKLVWEGWVNGSSFKHNRKAISCLNWTETSAPFQIVFIRPARVQDEIVTVTKCCLDFKYLD